MLNHLKTWLGLDSLSNAKFEQQRRELLKKTPIPVFWLFGKKGRGKT